MPDYSLKLEWDRRYAKGGLRGPGTRDQTAAGNAQFYRAKCDAIDRCMRAIGTSLENRRVLDAAGGTGEPAFIGLCGKQRTGGYRKDGEPPVSRSRVGTLIRVRVLHIVKTSEGAAWAALQATQLVRQGCGEAAECDPNGPGVRTSARMVGEG